MKSKSDSKNVRNNKSDWPNVPQAPSMSSCSKFNNMNGSSTNLINDLNYKMDLLLGKLFFFFFHCFIYVGIVCCLFFRYNTKSNMSNIRNEKRNDGNAEKEC